MKVKRIVANIATADVAAAKKFYGDESAWERIYNPNRHLLKDEVQSGSDKLLVGTGLTIKDPKFDLEGRPVGAGAAS